MKETNKEEQEQKEGRRRKGSWKKEKKPLGEKPLKALRGKEQERRAFFNHDKYCDDDYCLEDRSARSDCCCCCTWVS